MPEINRRDLLSTPAALALLGGGAMSATSAGGTARQSPWTLQLCPVHGVALALAPRGLGKFSFVPRRRSPVPSGYYALGDIDVRFKASGIWQDMSSAYHRIPVRPLPLGPDEIAAADLTPALPPSSPLTITRHWLIRGDLLILRFMIRNRSAETVEIGGLGLPMPFDNILTDRTLEQAHAEACFADPYVGLDAGYLQVTRLNGQGPALLVLPESGTPFEAWAPIADNKEKENEAALLQDRTKRGLTFEGFYRWMVASKAFAEREWRDADQWNEPTSFVLKPGESWNVGVRIVAAPEIRAIERQLTAHGHPVAVGVPGYVLPTDLPGDLFVRAAATVEAIDVFPKDALTVSSAGKAGDWQRYRVEGKKWGRARLTLRHAGGSKQSIHYFVTKPTQEAVSDLGRFLFDKQWYENPADGFGRSPSIMSYDRERNAIVTQDKRVWIAGLSDEGGAGSWLAAIMKQLDNPVASEVAKFERFHVEVIEKRLQVPDGAQAYGVRKSLFHYDPARAADYDPAIDWTTWASWKPDQANSVVRSFNYVHVAAAQWVLYRLARNRVGLVKAHDWRWYLDRAAQTALAMQRLAPEYVKFGQMEGDIFLAILFDLRREGMTAPANALEEAMRARAALWSREAYPFGSEMPWDSTGQEEVYAWMRHFGDHQKAELTREVILAYDPAVPHWGYNGSARRYWDFLFAGKTARIERQLHHYGSALNALPLFDSFRRDPVDIHLLRVAYGGLMGSLTNIDRDGFGACAFHSYPDMMRFDAYSGDYGMSFFGHAFAAATYLIRHPEFGWISFGGIVEETPSGIRLTLKDSARTRLFLASEKLWLTVEAGRIAHARLDPGSGEVEVALEARDRHTPVARLVIEGNHQPAQNLAIERGAYAVPLGDGLTPISLRRA